VPLTLTTVLLGCRMPGVDLMTEQKQGIKCVFFALRTMCLVSVLKLCVVAVEQQRTQTYLSYD